MIFAIWHRTGPRALRDDAASLIACTVSTELFRRHRREVRHPDRTNLLLPIVSTKSFSMQRPTPACRRVKIGRSEAPSPTRALPSRRRFWPLGNFVCARFSHHESEGGRSNRSGAPAISFIDHRFPQQYECPRLKFPSIWVLVWGNARS